MTKRLRDGSRNDRRGKGGDRRAEGDEQKARRRQRRARQQAKIEEKTEECKATATGRPRCHVRAATTAAFTPGSPAARSSGPSALKALTALTYCCLSPSRPVLGCPPTGRHLSPPTRRFLSPTIGRCLSLCPGLQHSSHSLPSHCCLSLRTCEHRCNGIWDNANMAWTTRASSVRDPHCWLLVHCLGRRLLEYQLA